jgi:hypothetical protein
MHVTTGRLERSDDEILAYDVSDEFLEIGAGSGKDRTAGYTLAYCTGLSACPA